MSTIQEQEITKSPLEMTSHTLSPSNLSVKSPQHHPPELASMTNVNVLDLHKSFDSSTDTTTVVKDNPIYVYASNSTEDSKHQQPSINMSTHDDDNDIVHQQQQQQQHQHQHHTANMHRISPVEHTMLDDRIITDDRSEQLLTKLSMSDDQILRLIGPNGESQQIISREIINGEHHILTRNENGEHIITRIVSADSKFGLGTGDDTGISYATVPAHHKIITGSPDGNTVYISNADVAGPTTMHCDGLHKGLQHHIFATSSGNSGNVGVSDTSDDSDDRDKDATVSKDDELYGDVKPQPLDLIYEDGAKTVIYTTTTGGEQKGMELYAGSELGIIGPEGQVMVPGGLQYATQQINGQTVFVVADTLDGDIGAQLQR